MGGKPVALDIALYIVLGAALVAIVTNAAGFAQAVTSVGNALNQETRTLAGK